MKYVHIPTRDERGATAVLFAIVAASLLLVCALAVDVGHIFAKRSALQSNVDLAVLAATAKLTQANGCNAEVVSTATAYLNKAGNKVPNQKSVNLAGSAGDLDGYIECVDWKVKLWAPTSRVDYGLASSWPGDDVDGVDVPAFAAASVMSPRIATLPMYIAQSCIDGSQIQITDPPNGHSATLTPPPFPEPDLFVPGLKFTGKLSPNRFLDADLTAGNTEVTIKVNQDFLSGDSIIFSRHDDTSVTASTAVPLADIGRRQTSINLPSEMTTAAPGVWWVRVQRGAGLWMADGEAQTITVGDIGLCSGSLSGNFGTLQLARTEPDHELVKNIILGAEPVLSINANPTLIPCPVAQSETTPNSPTDCLSTKPGFPGSELTSGLITGVDGLKGRLDADTTPGCSRSGNSARTPGSPALNDDTLACYLVGGASLSDVLYGSAAADGLSGEIVSSPRFVRIPILPEDPAHGSSTNYPISAFRYLFITTEGSSPITGYNGLTMRSSGTKIEKLSMAVLNEGALPDTVPNSGDVIAYTGSGPKVVVLVD